MTDLPHSPEAERAVLGTILMDPALLDDLDYLHAEDFYLIRHQWLWNIYQTLSERFDPIDELTVLAELKERGQYIDFGGSGYLTELSNSVATLEHVGVYAELIRRASCRRKLRDAASKIAQLAVHSTDTLEEIRAQAEAILFSYTRDDDRDEDFSIKRHMSDYFDQIEEHHKNGGLAGLPTGFTEYDMMTGGLYPGETTLIGARPGMGKTSFMLNVAYNAALQGKQVLFLTLEMTEVALANRLMAAHTGMDSHFILMGNMLDKHWEKFNDGIADLSKLPMYLRYCPGLTPAQMRAVTRRQQRRHGLDLVIVDYIGLMRTDEKFQTDNSKVSHISLELKSLAGELKVPIMIACQLNREMKDRADKRPQLWDLRESGSLEQDADNVIFINRPEYYAAQDKPGMAEIIVAKQRNGPTGIFSLNFAKGQTKFENMKPKQPINVPSWGDK